MGTRLFGSYFKELRKKQGKTLREYCLENGFDPGNISKMERGLMPPPSSREKLEAHAQCLGVVKGSSDWYEFFDLAAASTGKIPVDVMTDESLVSKLPMVFRTLRGEKLREDQLEDLIDRIRRA